MLHTSANPVWCHDDLCPYYEQKSKKLLVVSFHSGAVKYQYLNPSTPKVHFAAIIDWTKVPPKTAKDCTFPSCFLSLHIGCAWVGITPVKFCFKRPHQEQFIGARK
ncbi:hypothetical protein Bbelb_263270 [Branchiostoma belcheri]|nr:hypothetical protein Bbelb_263270 [Branchiostoma belcheri]